MLPEIRCALFLLWEGATVDGVGLCLDVGRVGILRCFVPFLVLGALPSYPGAMMVEL